jgi:DNA-binding transcriptional regulator GbsR (MarR family)
MEIVTDKGKIVPVNTITIPGKTVLLRTKIGRQTAQTLVKDMEDSLNDRVKRVRDILELDNELLKWLDAMSLPMTHMFKPGIRVVAQESLDKIEERIADYKAKRAELVKKNIPSGGRRYFTVEHDYIVFTS